MPYEVTTYELQRLTTLLLTSKYQEKLDNIQIKMMKMPQTDLQKALENMEYLMEIGNLDHFKLNLLNQSWIERTNLDVYFICVLIAFFSILMFLKFTKYFNKLLKTADKILIK